MPADNGIHYAICPVRATCPYPGLALLDRRAPSSLAGRRSSSRCERSSRRRRRSSPFRFPRPEYVFFLVERDELRGVDMPALAKALSGNPRVRPPPRCDGWSTRSHAPGCSCRSVSSRPRADERLSVRHRSGPRRADLVEHQGVELVSARGGSNSPPMKRVNVAGWLFVVLVTLLVEAGVRAFDYETSIATPSSTLRALVDELWSGGALSDEIGQTLSAYLQGLALAIVIGVGAGLLIGASRTLLDATSVVIEFLRPIPGIALIPLAILAFGLGVPTIRFRGRVRRSLADPLQHALRRPGRRSACSTTSRGRRASARRAGCSGSRCRLPSRASPPASA